MSLDGIKCHTKGNYDAIKDLIPSLPESQFALWQLKRLRLTDTALVDSAGYLGCDGVRVPVIRCAGAPTNTVVANHARRGMKAFIVDGGNAGRVPTVRMDHEPMFTVDAMRNSKHPRRAFLVGGQFAKPANEEGKLRPVQTRMRNELAFTVTAGNKGDWRAWLSRGQVVQMTPRCLARFQSFPDEYILPENKVLACRVIGNAVPPLMYQKIVAQLVEGI